MSYSRATELCLISIVLLLILTGCNVSLTETGITFVPSLQPTTTAPPQRSQAIPGPARNSGLVMGRLCYPGYETPPMTVFLENTVTHKVEAVDIARGQRTYKAELPAGDYIAYATTVGMNLRSDYRCDGSEEMCSFRVEPGRYRVINLCGWDRSPGIVPPAEGPAKDEVKVRLLQNMNARGGPHLSYPEIALVEAGALIQVVGRTSDYEWIEVADSTGHMTGWLHTPLTQVIGDPGQLPVTWKNAPPLTPPTQFVPAIWQSEDNRGIVHFKGAFRDGQGQPVNGFSILLDNGTWSVLSHPTGASHHYPDVEDGLWDVVIDNETDATGWWTMTVVRYECPDFETGFNAQCKQFTPLSETKVVKVVHPDDNVIEANWTCLENCDQGLYVKPYRKPVAPIQDSLLLYIEDRALKSSPPSPVFEREEMRVLYDVLPDTPDGLRAYLADNAPLLSPDKRYLLINGPAELTWLADLETGDLREISRPGVVVANWSADSRQFAYVKEGRHYVYDVATQVAWPIWRQADLADPIIGWAEKVRLKPDKTEPQISLNDLTAGTREPSQNRLTAALVELVEAKLPPDSAWVLSHDGQHVAYSLSIGGLLRNEIHIFDLEQQSSTLLGPINGYRVAEIRWSAKDRLLVIGATNPKFPSGGAIFTMEPEADVLPKILLESDTAYLVEVIPKP